MDFSDIHMLRTIMKAGSLSEASRQLNVSQPTLSRKLQRLEDDLKTQLFRRSPKGLIPTRITTYIVAQAEPLENHLNTIRRHVELSGNLERGEIRVGVGPIIEQTLIPEAVTRFVETTGRVQLSVVTEDDATLIDQFERSQLDVIIGPFDPDRWSQRNIIVREMIGDRIVAVARAEHPLFSEATISPDVLGQYPLVAPRLQGTVVQDKNSPKLPEPKIAADNYNLLRELTLRLDTICGGPETIFRSQLRSGEFCLIEVDLGIVWQSYLLVRPESLMVPVVEHFVHLCEEIAQDFRRNRSAESV